MMKSRNPIPRFTPRHDRRRRHRAAGELRGALLRRRSAAPQHRGRRALCTRLDVRDARLGRRARRRRSRVPPGLSSTNAPDGAIYVADFYEEFIAHGQNYQGQIDPRTGRIYRIRGKDLPLNKDVNLAGKASAQLVALLAHPNRWHRHTAVRLLGERRDATMHEPLQAALREPAEHPALEALWALHQMGALDEATAVAALAHPQPAVRAWSIRLLGDARKFPDVFLAAVDTSDSNGARCGSPRADRFDRAPPAGESSAGAWFARCFATRRRRRRSVHSPALLVDARKPLRARS